MCKTCKGYGLWAYGDPCPMYPMDAFEGCPTIKCPECGANANSTEDLPVFDPDKFAWNLDDMKVIPPKEKNTRKKKKSK